MFNLGWGKNTGFMRYGDRWKKQRKLSQLALHQNASQDIWPMIVKKSRISLRNLLTDPEDYAARFRWYAAI